MNKRIDPTKATPIDPGSDVYFRCGEEASVHFYDQDGERVFTTDVYRGAVIRIQVEPELSRAAGEPKQLDLVDYIDAAEVKENEHES
jgi:hypothetical protein